MISKINYELNENGTIKGYTIIPFDENQPFIECDVNDIVLDYSKVIDGQLVNDFNLADKLKELYG